MKPVCVCVWALPELIGEGGPGRVPPGQAVGPVQAQVEVAPPAYHTLYKIITVYGIELKIKGDILYMKKYASFRGKVVVTVNSWRV